MDAKEFREKGEEMIDYIVDYLDSVSQRLVSPKVSPGYLSQLLPSVPPMEGTSFEKTMEDFEEFIMPGITHWQHPRFHAYFPSNCSFPSTLAELTSDGIGCDGLNWNMSPSGEGLETIMADWLGKMMGLPNEFLRYADGSRGTGLIVNTSSESILTCMIAARTDALKILQERDPTANIASRLSSLVAYCSREAHSCVEKAAMISLVKIKILDTDENFTLRGKTLAEAMDEDKKSGYLPFFVSITLGTTSCCACDPVDEIGLVCKERSVWLHIDASYGGTALLCPEYRHLIKGIDCALSYNVNPAKWMLLNIDCAVMFITDRSKIDASLVSDKTQFEYGVTENDCAHPSNKRFRALKLWFVMRSYGIEGLQKHLRNQIRLAKIFEECVKKDERFEVLTSNFALVCFRLKGSNTLNKKLLLAVNTSCKLHVTPCLLHGQYVIRFVVCIERANEDDIAYAWSLFQTCAEILLSNEKKRYSVDPLEIARLI